MAMVLPDSVCLTSEWLTPIISDAWQLLPSSTGLHPKLDHVGHRGFGRDAHSAVSRVRSRYMQRLTRCVRLGFVR